MPLAGSTATFPMLLQTAAGVALVYADKAAFTGAGWDIIFHGSDGVALDPQPTWDLLVGSVATQPDIYQVQYVVPAGDFTAVVDVLSTNYVAPLAYRDFGDSASLNQIYGAILSSTGTIVSETATNAAVTVFQDDSISIDMVVTDSALAAVGATSLADLESLEAELKLVVTNATAAPEVTTFTESIVSDTAGNRVVRAVLDVFPAALDVDGPLGDNVQARLDLRITKTTKTLIAATVDVTAAWAAAAGSA